MEFLPKIEEITRDITMSHFLLMFGYRVFSFYFPLFLLERGFSNPEVGYVYLAIYFPIVILAPVIGFLNHRVNPALLASTGILGYGFYSLGMITIRSSGLFYFWQVLLGISAVLFFTSAKSVIMGSSLKSYDRSFGWFYSAPFYASVLAPAIGSFFIWKFDFIGVFLLSLLFHFSNAVFLAVRLKKEARKLMEKELTLKKTVKNYKKLIERAQEGDILPFLITAFSALVLTGFYHVFFILFLKDILSWSQDRILLFGSLFSLLFLPMSLLVIKKIEKLKSQENIMRGILVTAVFSVLFGLAPSWINFPLVLFLMLGKSTGDLMTSSGRSGLLSRKLNEFPEEAAAMETTLSPLGTALGGLIGSFVLTSLSYKTIFFVGGILLLAIRLVNHTICQRQYFVP